MAILVEYTQNGANENDDNLMPNENGFSHSFLWDGNYGYKVKCCNCFCKSHYFLGLEIDKFAASNLKETTGYLFCGGFETSPKGRKIYRRCFNSLRYPFSRVEDSSQNEQE